MDVHLIHQNRQDFPVLLSLFHRNLYLHQLYRWSLLRHRHHFRQ
jgi:hypothetical protein